MKVFYLIFILLFVSAASQAQLYTITPKSQNKQSFASNGDIIFFAQMYNHSTTESVFSWERIENTKPANWLSEICDPNVCWDVQTNSGDFTILPGDSGPIRVTLITAGTPGTALTRLVIFLKSDPSLKDTISFAGKTWGTSIDENKLNAALGVYPNPVTSELNISYRTDKPLRAEIYNLTGLKIASFIYDNTGYNTTGISAGMYLLRLYEGDKVMTGRFAKTE